LGAIAHIQLIQNPIDMGFNSTFTDAQSSRNIFQTACLSRMRSSVDSLSWSIKGGLRAMQTSLRFEQTSLNCSQWTSGLRALEDPRFSLQFKRTAARSHFGRKL